MAAEERDSFFDDNSEPADERIAVGLHKLGLALKQQNWLQANDQGLSPTQGQILAALANGAPRASELAKQLGVSMPTISDSVRVLVEKALVEKLPDPKDARASLLSLTKQGKALAKKASGWPEYLASAVRSMSSAEQAVFLSGLSKMIRALQESGQIPVQSMCVSCKYFRENVHTGDKPHHCGLVNAPMGNRHLRLYCPEQVPA